ncbi:MAG: hypothetical protein J5725_08690 [Bacteroidales bacterium]|nr:hypothetical protein [Bacteroidales bacterium]
MDTGTITFLIGIISCVIGVSTFITGRMAKAEKNGSMETKITQALDGISSINKKLEEFTKSQHTIDLMVNSHEEQLRTLEKEQAELRGMIDNSNQTNKLLTELLNFFKERG